MAFIEKAFLCLREKQFTPLSCSLAFLEKNEFSSKFGLETKLPVKKQQQRLKNTKTLVGEIYDVKEWLKLRFVLEK